MQVKWKIKGRTQIYFEKCSLSGDFRCVGGMEVVLFLCLMYSITDTFGLNQFKRIPLLETISGNLTPSCKAGHLKMTDLEIVDHVLGADSSRIDVLLVYDKIFNVFSSLTI